jgi:hypothetical protein
MKTSTALLLVIYALLPAPCAQGDTFGSVASTFDIEFVSIDKPHNPDDTTGTPNPAGRVEYAYRMGKFEISRDMITKANDAGGLGITMDHMAIITDGARDEIPATGISWFEAATFVNWLNTSTGHTPAYKFSGGTFQLWQSDEAGFNPANPFRNRQALYVLPTADEWYKAAYYDPVSNMYHDYPTGSDSIPAALTSGTAVDTAVWGQTLSRGPADITLAGGLSRYGTTGQGGNAWEWEETEFDLVNNSSSSRRGLRGGAWDDVAGGLLSTVRLNISPTNELFNYGFRVASVPEPTTMLLGALATMGLFVFRN